MFYVCLCSKISQQTSLQTVKILTNNRQYVTNIFMFSMNKGHKIITAETLQMQSKVEKET